MKNTLKGFLIPTILSLLLIQWLLYVYGDLEGVGQFDLKQAQFIMSDESSLFDFPKAAPMISLPDNWNTRQFGLAGSGWYRLQLNMLQEEQGNVLWGLFIPRANMNITVFMNGSEVGSSGHFTEPMSRNWQRPLYFTIPANTLSKGVNTIHVHLKSYAYEGGGLSEILLGPHDDLYPWYEGRFFFQIDVSIIAFCLNMFAGLIALILWFLQRYEKGYAWFALISFSSSLFIINNVIREIPVSRDIWHYAVYISIGWFALGLLGFAKSFEQPKLVRWEKVLILYMLFSSVLIMLLQNIFIALFWHIGSLVMAAYASIVFFQLWLKKQENIYLLLYSSFLFVLLLGFHDWYTRLSGLQFTSPILMHFGIPLMLISISIVLGIRFAQYAKQHEAFNITLVHRVDDMKHALTIEHERVQTLLMQETQVKERERIMKDLHDGLGGYLLSASSIARLQNTDKGLQQALNDAIFWLRTSIDTLDETHGDIESLLGTLRYRLEPQLKSCGIQLHWHMDDLAEHELSSEGRLHLMRIVQESITNVIKHAQASRLSISTTKHSNACIKLHIKDNGCGFSDASASLGRGLTNMHERITALGGTLELISEKDGTSLCFWFDTI